MQEENTAVEQKSSVQQLADKSKSSFPFPPSKQTLAVPVAIHLSSDLLCACVRMHACVVRACVLCVCV